MYMVYDDMTKLCIGSSSTMELERKNETTVSVTAGGGRVGQLISLPELQHAGSGDST
jgi:hypothetical protein